jgi:hypothetical protein
LDGDLNTLVSNPIAQNLRNQYQADLVVLFTDGWYSDGKTRGASKTVTLENNLTYAIVELWHATSKKTFAHEVGHLYGCRHDDTPGNPAYAQGYNIKTLGITVDRTVMVGKSISENQASNRLLNFSNPNIQVGGKATGTNNENNALRVSQSHSIVGAFRPNPSPLFSAYLDGPTYVTTPGGKNYELNYSCGNAPYSFVWEYSYDGINYTTSNITSEIFTWYFYQNQKIYLKGTVKGNGQSVSAFISVTAQMPSPYKEGITDKESIDFAVPMLNAAPNPSSKLMRIGYNLSSDAQVTLEIVNHAGQVVEILVDDEKKSKGLHSHEWITNNIAIGSYFIRLNAGQYQESKQVVISH